MGYFRRLYSNQEISSRAYELNNDVIESCPGFYTAWCYRGMLIDKLGLDLENEIKIISDLSRRTHKNYQIWYFRRELLARIKNPKGEIEFLKEILNIDAKNIHAWGYMQWLVKEFGLWEKDREIVMAYIEEDPFNNSAWNEKYFIDHNTGNLINLKEAEFVVKHCENIYNECPYLYARIFCGSEFENFVKGKVVDIIGNFGVSRLNLQFLLFLYEKNGKKEISEIICGLLEKNDHIRKSYWGWRKKNCKGNNISRDPVDLELCRAINDKCRDNVMFEYYKNSIRPGN